MKDCSIWIGEIMGEGLGWVCISEEDLRVLFEYGLATPNGCQENPTLLFEIYMEEGDSTCYYYYNANPSAYSDARELESYNVIGAAVMELGLESLKRYYTCQLPTQALPTRP